MDLITPEEMAALLVRAVNRGFSGAPVAGRDIEGASFIMTAPATGQLFTVRVLPYEAKASPEP